VNNFFVHLGDTGTKKKGPADKDINLVPQMSGFQNEAESTRRKLKRYGQKGGVEKVKAREKRYLRRSEWLQLLKCKIPCILGPKESVRGPPSKLGGLERRHLLAKSQSDGNYFKGMVGRKEEEVFTPQCAPKRRNLF